jgi:hypothetical protein
VQVPPIEPLYHDRKWLTVSTNGFHGGVLDGLRDFYN